MEIRKKVKLVFLPGGPWISGVYFDSLIKDIDLPSERIVYLNHEQRYHLQKDTTFKEIVQDVKDQLSRIKEDFVLIGHSFGGLLALELYEWMKQNHYHTFSSFIISVPFTHNRSEEFQRKIAFLDLQECHTDAEFMHEFSKVLPLYFNSQDAKDLNFFKEMYFEKNKSANVPEKDMKRLKEIYLTHQLEFINIYGDQDLLLTADEKLPPDNSNIFAIPNCGHFPMLEDAQRLKEIITSVLL
jgi:pimeloyl-ACP methyl ester carboxylesterase